ncbi:hypothetical protein RQP46_005627 [Phenoliferia psychrophenolica]
MTSHASPPHLAKRTRTTPLATRAACSFFTYPLATDTLPVYEDLSITWDPTCISISSPTIDLYLNVKEETGLTAVHEWTGIQYSAGTLATQLKPVWWNASTGAGEVSGQLIITARGSPIWDTVAPAGPLFSITYNGTYPASVTGTASEPVYTGPSVESVANASSSSTISGGKLGAAVAIPVLAVIACIGAYVAWNKLRKRPEQKRWSAVIDQRMSMISQGTWQPPRPSMSSRPGSHYQHSHAGSNAGSMSSYSGGAHLFSDLTRPSSSYSQSQPSPLGGGQMRPPQPAEMRQIGQGERSSKVSFSGEAMGRPSFSSSHRPGPSSLRNASGPGGKRVSSYYAASSMNGNGGHGRSSSYGTSLRGSMYVPDAKEHAQHPLPRNNSTWEQLADQQPPPLPSSSPYHLNPVPSPVNARLRKPSNLSNYSTHARESVADPSLAEELAHLPAIAVMRDGQLAFSRASPTKSSYASSYHSGSSSSTSPFKDPSPTASPQFLMAPEPPTKSMHRPGPPPVVPRKMNSHMPMASRNSIMSPDELLRNYAVKRETSAPNLGAAGGGSLGVRRPTLAGSRSASFLSAPRRIMKSLKKGGAGTSPAIEYEEDNNAAVAAPTTTIAKEKSPFEDQVDKEQRRMDRAEAGEDDDDEESEDEFGRSDMTEEDFRRSAMTVESRYSDAPEGGQAM